jgi:DNA-binding GntR family transcriptional regulator
MARNSAHLVRSGRAHKGGPRGRTRQPNRLRVQTAEQILDIIKHDGLNAGHHLTELSVARRVGLSRTPVRAALQLLSEQGILVLRPRHGYVLARNGHDIGVPTELPMSADETLYQRLARDKVANRLPACVTETFLMRRYGASRNLVSAALSRLSEEGLVRRGRGREWAFIEILNSASAQQESYQLRLMVEPAALLLHTFKADREELIRLRRQHMNLLAAGEIASRSREVFHMDASFHEQLARMSGNSFVLAAVRQQNRLRRLIEYQGYRDVTRVHTWCREHVAIVDALLRGAARKASALLTLHLTNAANVLMLREERRRRLDGGRGDLRAPPGSP